MNADNRTLTDGSLVTEGHRQIEPQLCDAITTTPKFYGGTFCIRYEEHLSPNQFVWYGTDEHL